MEDERTKKSSSVEWPRYAMSNTPSWQNMAYCHSAYAPAHGTTVKDTDLEAEAKLGMALNVVDREASPARTSGDGAVGVNLRLYQ